MKFEWDEQKRAANLVKHGIDFECAKLIFEGQTLEGMDERRDYGEERIGAYGIADGELLFVVYTWRGNYRRIISARKAGTYEREIYTTRTDQRGKSDA